jgi:hypothetical protein
MVSEGLKKGRTTRELCRIQVRAAIAMMNQS